MSIRAREHARRLTLPLATASVTKADSCLYKDSESSPAAADISKTLATDISTDGKESMFTSLTAAATDANDSGRRAPLTHANNSPSVFDHLKAATGEDYYSLISELTPEQLLQHRNKSKKVTINVGGQRHEVLWSTLGRIPDTRLGKLRSCVSHDAIMSICDDYDIVQNEYFFDRHPTAFSTFIDFYRTGKLHLLDDVCIMSYGDELEYWGIEEYYLEPCCLNKYNQRKDHILEEMRKEKECLNPDVVEIFGTTRYERVRKYVWNLLEKPDSSKPAKVILL